MQSSDSVKLHNDRILSQRDQSPIQSRFATPRMALSESGRMDLAWAGRSWHVRSYTATRNMRASLRAESRVRVTNRRQIR
jgi:hypothetical protein